MIESILKYTEFSCGIILLLFAVIQIIYKNRQFININIAGLYLCLSYVILSLWSFKSGVIFYVPWLIHTDIAMAFAIGPFVFFYLISVLGFSKTPDFRYLLHFAPAILVFAVIAINNITSDLYPGFFATNQNFHPVNSQRILVRYIDIISNIYMITYFVVSTTKIHIYINKGNHQSSKELFMIFYYMFFVLSFSGMMLTSTIIGNNTLNVISIYLLTLAGLWYFIFSFRYPDFTQKAIREAKTIRYQTTMLNGIDTEAVLMRLDDFMENEKIFTDYELTLPKLSAELMITSHQLSKILNTHKKMNFRSLLNTYRIRESMRQMTEYPDMTILEIALASGFNSKSSFNSVFLKSTGMTPSEYRESKGI